MTGTILNGAAIVLGGIVGLVATKHLSNDLQNKIKVVLGVLVVWAGLSTTWKAINGTFGQVMGQIGIVMLALVLGNAVGKLLRIQKGLNRLGQYATERFASVAANRKGTFGDGFVTTTLLFCVGPMAILGSLQDGLTGDFKTLAIKSVMDGLATLAFAPTFGWGVVLSALPVVAFQGTITLGAKSLEPYLHNQALLDPVNATGGLLIVCLALLIFDVRKVPMGDYLPSLVWAPLLTYWLR